MSRTKMSSLGTLIGRGRRRRMEPTTTTTKHKQSSGKKTETSSSEKMRASYILIKHQWSRLESSWKDPDGRLISGITHKEDLLQLRAIHRLILSGNASFKDLAAQHSDCNSARRDGDLGAEVMEMYLLNLQVLLSSKLL